MRKFILALSLILGVCGYSHAQTRTFPYFNGPVTPGDCVQLDPTATLLDPALKDSGVVCGGGGGGGGTPGGSNFSLQTNNSGSFGGVSSVSKGSALASNGTGAFPVWQLKPTIDVRDYGVVGDGSTDDTSALQAAINAACPTTQSGSHIIAWDSSTGSPLKMKVSSTINFTKCWDVFFEGGSGEGETGQNTSGLIWAGAAGGTVMLVNQTRDSIFQNFFVKTQTAAGQNNANIAIDIDEQPTITTISTNNQFRNIFILSLDSNASFVGFRLGATATGNVEHMSFEHTTVECAGHTATSSNNGLGWLIEGPSGAEPYFTVIHDFDTVNCSKGIDVEQVNILDIDGGFASQDFTDLFVNGGRGISQRHVRSEPVAGASQIVIGTSGSSGAHDLTLEENSFSALSNNTTTISYSFNTTGGLIRLIKNDWDTNTTVTPFGPTGGGVFVGVLDSQDNFYPNNTLCAQTAFANSGTMFSSSNDQPVGGVCNLGGTILGASNAKLNLLSVAANPSQSSPSPIFTLQGAVYFGGTSNTDSTILRHISLLSATKAYFSFSHPASTINIPYGISLPAVFGGVSTSVLSTPILDGVVPLGVSGATTWTYKLVANDGAGNTTAASTASSTTTGNAVLSGGNCNTIQWRPREGAYNYTIYRTGSGGTPSSTGVVSTVWPSQDGGTGYVIQDCGLTGDGTIPPTTNTTGNVSTPGQFISTASTGTPPLVVASTTVIPNLNANLLNGATFAIPGPIGSTTPSTGVFTTLTVNTQLNQAIGTSHCWNSDSGISRDSAGVFDFGNCTPGDKSGTVQASAGIFGSGPGSLQVTTGAFSRLSACVAGLEGTMAPVNDSTTATWGGTITGSGTNHVLAYCDGTNWTVAAK